jgi:hypothetical protein
MKLSIVSLLTGVFVASLSASALADDAAATPSAPAAPVVTPAPAANADAKPATPSDGRTANNAVYLELLGNGGLYSINYERMIGDFGVRVGASYFSVSGSDGTTSASASLMTFPIVASYYLGPGNHKLQLGLGATIFDVSASASTVGFVGSGSGVSAAATGVIGYRYVPKNGGFDFGIGFTPLLGPGGLSPFGGMHFGAVF